METKMEEKAMPVQKPPQFYVGRDVIVEIDKTRFSFRVTNVKLNGRLFLKLNKGA